MITKVGSVAIGGQLATTSGAPSARRLWRPPPLVSFRRLLQRYPAGPRGTAPAQSAPQPRTAEYPGIAAARFRPPLAHIDDALDPLHRRRAALAPPVGYSILPPAIPQSLPGGSTGSAATPPAAVASLEELIPALVRRIAWGGDRHRGSVRLELGAGELAGTTLIVHADAGSVRVHMVTARGVDTASWQQRISRRLASRGIVVESVEVT